MRTALIHDLSGLTLIELLLALAVLAVVLATAIPGLDALLLNIRMQNSVNELMHSLYSARQNSNSSGTSHVLCSSADGQQCNTTNEWSRGWLLFANNDEDDPPRVDPGEPVLESATLSPRLQLRANRSHFVLRPFGLRITNGTFIWCDRRGARHARALILSYTGKPRSSTTTANGAALTCPTPP